MDGSSLVFPFTSDNFSQVALPDYNIPLGIAVALDCEGAINRNRIRVEFDNDRRTGDTVGKWIGGKDSVVQMTYYYYLFRRILGGIPADPKGCGRLRSWGNVEFLDEVLKSIIGAAKASAHRRITTRPRVFNILCAQKGSVAQRHLVQHPELHFRCRRLAKSCLWN